MAQLSQASTGGPGGGFCPITVDVLGTVRGASFAAGDVVQRDVLGTDADSTSALPGNDQGTSSFNNFVATTAESVTHAEVGVCLDAITENSEGRIRMAGVVTDCFVVAATGTMAEGSAVGVLAGNNFNGAPATGARIVGTILVAGADTTPTVRTGDWTVYFNGFTGIGSAI